MCGVHGVYNLICLNTTLSQDGRHYPTLYYNESLHLVYTIILYTFMVKYTRYMCIKLSTVLRTCPIIMTEDARHYKLHTDTTVASPDTRHPLLCGSSYTVARTVGDVARGV